MAGGFFSKILGRANQSGDSSQATKSGRSGPWGRKASWLQPCFKSLEHRKSGLAARTAHFVETGEDRPVLAEIAAAVSQQNAQIPYDVMNGDVGMQKLALLKMHGKPEMIARMAEVLDAAEPNNTAMYSLSRNIKLDMPGPVLALMRLMMGYGQARMKEEKGYGETEAKDFIPAVEMLGGRAADIVLVDLAQRYGQRIYLSGSRPLGDVLLNVVDHDEIIHAFRQMDGATRAIAIEKLRKSDRAKDPAMIPFLTEELGSGSAKCREQSRLLLLQHDPEIVEPLVIDALSGGKSSLRSEAAVVLGELGSEAGRTAMEARRKVEKTSSVVAVLDQYLSGGSSVEAAGPEAFDGRGYIAADGSTVEVTPHAPLEDDGSAPLNEDDRAALAAARKQHDQAALDGYERHIEWLRQHGKKGARRRDRPLPIDPSRDRLLDWANAPVEGPFIKSESSIAIDTSLSYGYGAAWLDQRLHKLPLVRQIRIALLASNSIYRLFFSYRMESAGEAIIEAMDSGEIDMRHILDEADRVGLRSRINQGTHASHERITPSVVINNLLNERFFPNDMIRGLWPLVAENVTLVIEALPPRTTDTWVNRRALMLLGCLPKLPAAAVQPVLFCAISERTVLRDFAQKMLADVDGIDARLIDVLQDKRQAVRANAARFLADRGTKDAIKPLVARLKKEKSESARAEMISALSRLGADTAPYLGTAALMKEAAALASKLPSAKIDWLPIDQAPVLKWADGKATDPVIPEAWLKLALKLKDPSGSPLFGLYFDQMDPDSVAAFCDWVLSAWIAYDSDIGDQAALRAKARENAEADIKRYSNHNFYANMSVDQLAEQYLSYLQGSYPNSGTDSKGILALTHRATAAKQATRIQAYLKNHGKRVSQAKALIEVLAATGTPEALQVLVATATRFKQRTVRELAEKLVGEIAAERGWTEDELADRSVPSGGFEDDGTLTLPVSEESKLYLARLGEDLTVKLFNPEAKQVKALPAGKDTATKESKSLLSAAKKTVKVVTAQQSDRLYGAMVAGRRWPLSDWTNDIRRHPILSRLSERIIWLGYDTDGALVTTFRPTPEGDLLTAGGDDAELSSVAHVGIAHTSHLEEDTRAAWFAHLEDFEVKSLFAQVSRPMQVLTGAQETETSIDDREGWLMESLRLRSATTKAGFDRGAIEDGAGFNTYVKPFKSAGLTAVLEFTGSYVPEDNIPTAIISLYFVRGTNSHGRKVKLGDVPPILLSECWADLYQIAEAGAFDPDWRKKGLY